MTCECFRLMLRERLRLWFSFDVPVDRRAYFLSGTGLMLGKYAVDAALIWRFTGRFWSLLDYLNPLWSVRQELFSRGPSWLAPGLVLFALPFLWVGVSMSARRAVDAGQSAWLALLFFVPVVNYGVMAALSLLPPASTVKWPVAPPPPAVDERFESAMLGAAVAIGNALLGALIGIYLRRAYSAGLFLGLPFTMGYVSAYVYTRRVPDGAGGSVTLALASVTMAGGALVLFALEGALCTAMALPIAWAVAIPGALLGRAIALRSVRPGTGAMALLAPLMVAVEPRATPPSHDVVSVVEIDAPPSVVLRHVVTFPELGPPGEWLFRVGVAAPIAARIEGTGLGAVRYCDFTTGSFVEPITAWEEGRLLAFDITQQAQPMRELSPYGDIRPPHLDGYFRATHGEFRLIELPGGRTRLVGQTRYYVDLFPQAYWTILADRIVEAIHLRVLQHIKRLSET